MNRLLRLARSFASNQLQKELGRASAQLSASRAELEENRAELGEIRRSTQVIHALDRASVAMASVTSESDIYVAATRTLHELGFQTTVLTFDEKRTRLSIRYIDMDPEFLRKAEDLAGMRKEDFSFRPDATAFHRAVVSDRQTVFFSDAAKLAVELLPSVPPGVVRTICRLAGVSRFIGSPILVDGEVIGMVSVSAPKLTEHDVPVVRVFSQQLSSALFKARLVAELQGSMKELEETQEQLLHAQKIEAVGLLASGVAHDFNNLLSAITLSAKLVADAVDDPDAKDDLQVIQESCERGAALVAQLLALGSKQELNISSFDVDALLRDLERLLCRVLGEDITVTLKFDAQKKWVSGDRHQIEQVLVNLATNARDAMPHGGELCISTSLERSDDLGENSPREQVRILIRDNGAGISDSARERIFEPFFTTKSTGRGTGLGLSVAKAILGTHGGDIDVEPHSPGGGTTFVLFLPRSDAPQAAALPVEDKAAMPGRSELVLIVEDEPLVLRSAARVLKKGGYRVITAEDAESARAMVQRHGTEIGLILCDVGLPDARGPALLDTFVPQLPNTRMLVASGYMGERAERALLDERGWQFLAKPYSGVQLLKATRQLLG